MNSYADKKKIIFKNEFYPEGVGEEYLQKVGNTYITKCLGILLTNQCNAECSLCCANSSPYDNRGIELSDVIQLVVQAKEMGFLQIGISGGEAMLRYKDILEIGNKCQEEGLTFTLATNGYWAKSKDQCIEKLSILKSLGLVKIHASFDESHSEFISSFTFEKFLNACQETGVPVEIHSAYYKDGKRLSELISEGLLNEFKVYESPVIRSGRAEEELPIRFVTLDEIPSKPCPMPSQIVVNYDSKVYPCCSVSGFTENICIGDAAKDSIVNIIDKIKKDVFLQYIQARGFSELLPLVLKDLCIQAPPMLTTCEVCMFVGSRKDIAEKFREEIELFYKENLLSVLDEKINSLEIGNLINGC